MDKYLTKNNSNEEKSDAIPATQNANPRKRKHTDYNKSWEDNNVLKPWIKRSDNNLAFCNFCKCELKALAGITDLKSHALTSKHVENAKAIQLSTTSVFTDKIKQNVKVTNIEVHLAAFCAEHNIPFLAMDHLVPLLQKTLEDSDLIKKTTCARTKTTAIVKNVLGESHHDELCNMLKESLFSLCIDESTDVSTTKLLSLIVRMEYKGKICDFFFDLIKVTDCSAIGIYDLIVNVFEQNGINYKKNLIGFGADGANTMTGAYHSVAKLLKADCPNLIIFKCICHSFSLCANYACSFLPSYIEGGARDIYNFIQNSPKRIDLFADLQILLDYKPRKMLHPSQTRWLSLEQTVNQLLSRLDVLKLFFLHENLEKFDSTQRIISYLQNPEFELYLLFLKFILNDINKLNRLFQSESPQIHLINSEVRRLYLKIFEYVVKDEYISTEMFKKINLNDQEYLKDLKDIYLGAEVSIALKTTHKLPDNNEKDFREHCSKFYVGLCNRLLQKFDFDNDFLRSVEILAPANVVKGNMKSISELCNFVPNVIGLNNIQETDDEWRELLHFDFGSNNLLEEKSIEKFWEVILNAKRCDGSEPFPHLKKLIYAILSIPISTANVERIFSQININKTKTRNKLEIPTLCGILKTKDFLKKNNYNCTNFVQTKQMEIKFNKNMYN